MQGAVNLKKLGASVNSLYAAVVTSITASTFKMAGRLTLALTCGGLIKVSICLSPALLPLTRYSRGLQLAHDANGSAHS